MASAFITYTILVRKITLFTVMLFAAVLLHFLHSLIFNTLYPLFDVDEYQDVIGWLWYWSYGVTDFAMIATVIHIKNRYDLLSDRVSYIVLILYGLMGSIQILRFIDREIGTDLITELYSNTIVLSNIAISVLVVVMAVRVVLVKSGKAVVEVLQK